MIDPVAIEIFGFSIRWYGIAWMVSFFWILYVPSFLVKKARWSKHWEDMVTGTLLWVVIGGRVGSVLVSQFSRFLQDPWMLFRIWEGGMSFFGALFLGGLYLYHYTRKHKIPFFEASDAGLVHIPLALGIVRVANFINGELFGRITDQTWGFYFKKGGPFLRHPSQLYEAFFEGLVLWAILYGIARYRPQKGLITTAFVLGYGIIRLTIEVYFREPTYELLSWISTGALFSLMLIMVGCWVGFKVVVFNKILHTK